MHTDSVGLSAFGSVQFLPSPDVQACHGRAAGRHRSVDSRLAQRGFSLVEISIVTAIILLLAVIGIPAIGSYIIENKVPKVGQEIMRLVMQARVSAFDGSNVPYSGIDTANFLNQLYDSSVLSIQKSSGASRLLHGLGTGGEVTVRPLGAGESFSVVLTKVNHAACPAIASVLQRVASSITVAVEGQAAAVVKDAQVHYNALTTESRCARGDVNTFTFVIG